LNHKNQRTSVVKGAILTVGLRWADRLIGFVSTMILARLLMPDDFGVVAMASLVILLADVFLNLGVNVALIQNQEATQEHYDTAWTLRLLQTILSCVVVSVSAPLAADYFNDQRVVLVIQLTSLHLIFNGFENIGIINFQKGMRFLQDFHFRISKRMFGFIITMVAAWYLRSYWALVIGTLAGSSFGVLLSYVMHPMRPKISFAKSSEIFQVSQWMLVNSVGRYLNNNLHNLLVGHGSEATILGGYSLANEISSMPSEELLAPINRVLFPAFAAAKYNLNELKRIFLLAQGVQVLVAIPASVGLMLVAHEAVFILLGERWLFIVPFLKILVLANVTLAITTSGSYVMLTLGLHKKVALITWLQVFILLTLFLFVGTDNPYNIAVIRSFSIFVVFFMVVLVIINSIPNICMLDMVRTVYRPFFATLLMFFLVNYIDTILNCNFYILLAVKILIGAFIYSLSIYSLWYYAGKPEGAEKYILNKIFPIKKTLI
jgi:O-antigen/teichoic acid export membrane protein